MIRRTLIPTLLPEGEGPARSALPLGAGPGVRVFFDVQHPQAGYGDDLVAGAA